MHALSVHAEAERFSEAIRKACAENVSEQDISVIHDRLDTRQISMYVLRQCIAQWSEATY